MPTETRAIPEEAGPRRGLHNGGAFARYIAKASPILPLLPVVHTTYALSFREMAEAGRMTPQPCNVFVGDDLLYFFYGRPAYKIFADYDSAMVAEAPIALVLSSNILGDLKRLFPFDSGGFDRYRQFMSKHFQLSNFQLDPGLFQPNKVAGAFFASNIDYYEGCPRHDVKIPADQFEAASMLEMLRYQGKGALDDRAWTIELQIPKEVVLDRSTVLAVVIPEVLVDTDTGRIAVEEWNIKPLTYPLSGRWRPNDYHSKIRDLIRDFLKSGGFL